MEGVFFLELSGFDLTKGRRSWGYKGAIAPPDFSRNRSKTFSFKRPWIATCPPPVFLNLPTALPRNKETYRTNMTRIGGKSLSFHCSNKAQSGRQPFTHSDAFFQVYKCMYLALFKMTQPWPLWPKRHYCMMPTESLAYKRKKIPTLAS